MFFGVATGRRLSLPLTVDRGVTSRNFSRKVARGQRPSCAAMGQVLVCVFAVLLCLVNAVVWTTISEMPLMGAAWVGAAAACLFMQKWTRG